MILTRKVKQVTRFMLEGKCLGTETIEKAHNGRARVAYDFIDDVQIVREEIPIRGDGEVQRDACDEGSGK
mgnify:CR=1 FL=1